MERFLDYRKFVSSAVQVEELEGDDNGLWCFGREPEHGYVLENHFFKKTKRKHFSAVFSFTSLRYLPRLAMVLV